ncbi:UNVERIFIED_CONTAM: hypothetical protein FKN15_046713 [Acipenser sinensis]
MYGTGSWPSWGKGVAVRQLYCDQLCRVRRLDRAWCRTDHREEFSGTKGTQLWRGVVYLSEPGPSTPGQVGRAAALRHDLGTWGATAPSARRSTADVLEADLELAGGPRGGHEEGPPRAKVLNYLAADMGGAPSFPVPSSGAMLTPGPTREKPKCPVTKRGNLKCPAPKKGKPEHPAPKREEPEKELNWWCLDCGVADHPKSHCSDRATHHLQLPHCLQD